MDLKNVYRLIRLLIVIGIIVSMFILLYYIARYTYPFIIAILFAFIMNPLVNTLETKANFSRPFSVIVAILLALAAIIGFLVLLVVELINGTTYLAEHIPAHFKAFINYFERLVSYQVLPVYQKLASMISTLDASQQTVIMNNIQKIGEEIASTGANILQNLLKKIPATLAGLPNYVSVLLFSLLGTFFISKDWYKLTDRVQKIAPRTVSESGRSVFTGLKRALFGFIKAQITLISITAVIVLIGLLILKIDYAITIAIIIGLIDLLPYMGTGLIFVPWILYMFFTGNYVLTIGLSILYIIVIVQRQVTEPKILATNIGIDPLATLVALFAGFQLFGFAGLIIGPIFLVIINTLHQTGVFQQIWSYIKGPGPE